MRDRFLTDYVKLCNLSLCKGNWFLASLTSYVTSGRSPYWITDYASRIGFALIIFHSMNYHLVLPLSAALPTASSSTVKEHVSISTTGWIMFFMPQEKKLEMLKKKTLTCLNKFSRKRRAHIFCKIFSWDSRLFFGGWRKKWKITRCCHILWVTYNNNLYVYHSFYMAL